MAALIYYFFDFKYSDSEIYPCVAACSSSVHCAKKEPFEETLLLSVGEGKR